jgi:hypothetical protein
MLPVEQQQSLTVSCAFPFLCLIENRVKIAVLGGIEAIMNAMSTHKDHFGVQEKACNALGNLASNEGMFCPLPYRSLVYVIYVTLSNE